MHPKTPLFRTLPRPTDPQPLHAPPIFLTPLLSQTRTNSFSTTAPLSHRKRRQDNNPNRGVSALRRKMPFKPLSISPIVRTEGLPKPVLDPKRRAKVEVDPNHGLYGFFNQEKKLLTKPEVEGGHGEYDSADCSCLSRVYFILELPC